MNDATPPADPCPDQIGQLAGVAESDSSPPVERVVTEKRLGEPDQQWRYWLTRPCIERIRAVEELRREYHGWADGSEPRLERIVTRRHLRSATDSGT
jgi:hypothetical protein